MRCVAAALLLQRRRGGGSPLLCCMYLPCVYDDRCVLCVALDVRGIDIIGWRQGSSYIPPVPCCTAVPVVDYRCVLWS